MKTLDRHATLRDFLLVRKQVPNAPPRAFLAAIIWFLSLVVPSSLPCQPANLRFDHITTLDGLSQDRVTCIHRDRFGFLWVGTEDGLNRYDGYSIKVYKHSPRDSSTLPGNSISDLCDYNDDDLLVATSSGLRVYNRAGDAFRIPPEPLSGYALKPVRSPMKDRQGRLWMIVDETRLLRYDPAKSSAVELDLRTAGKVSLHPPSIVRLFLDDRDSVWITTDSTFGVLLDDSGEFKQYDIRDPHWGDGKRIPGQ